MSVDDALEVLGDVRILRGDNGEPVRTRAADPGFEGDDSFKIRYVREHVAGATGVPMSCGVSAMEPSEFDFRFEQDESLLVLEGEADVTIDGGRTISLRGGDAVYFPKGTHTSWRVHTAWREFFTLVG